MSTISPTVLANMPPPASPSVIAGYNAQVDDLASVLDDGSTASGAEKAAAWDSLQVLLGSAALYKAGAKDALEKAVDLGDNSETAKRVQIVAGKYQSAGTSAGMRDRADPNAGPPNVGQLQLDIFSKFSEDDQRLLLVATGMTRTYADLESFKTAMQEQSDEFIAQKAAAAPVVEVSLSDEAKAAIGGSDERAATTPAEQALAKLKAGAASSDKGSVALTMLQKAAEARETRNAAKADEARSGAQKWTVETRQAPYEAGDNVDLVT